MRGGGTYSGYESKWIFFTISFFLPAVDWELRPHVHCVRGEKTDSWLLGTLAVPACVWHRGLLRCRPDAVSFHCDLTHVVFKPTGGS